MSSNEEIEVTKNLTGRDFFDLLEETCGEDNIIMIGLKIINDEEYTMRIAAPPYDKASIINILQEALEDVKTWEEQT